MNKIWIIIAIISMFLITAIVGVKKPSLNKPVAINNGQIVTQIKEQVVSETEAKINNVSTPNVDAKVAPVETKTTQTVVKTPVVKPKPQPKPQPKQQTIKKQEQPKPVKKQEKTIVEKPVEPEIVEKSQEPPKIDVPVEPLEVKKKVLTEEEEIIAWNKWRSEIQNSLMRDYNVPAPLGTTYKFSFSIDKWGNISNLSVGCETSICPKAGTDNIRTLIPKLGPKGLLTFPEGTQRIMTVVNGGFVIVDSAYQFSTPDDYSDYEKIKRQVER